jgi:hypothetical protein
VHAGGQSRNEAKNEAESRTPAAVSIAKALPGGDTVLVEELWDVSCGSRWGEACDLADGCPAGFEWIQLSPTRRVPLATILFRV